MHSHGHLTVTDSAPSPAGVILSLSKLFKAWSPLYSSGCAESVIETHIMILSFLLPLLQLCQGAALGPAAENMVTVHQQ